MLGLFGSKVRCEQYEKLLLIAESVKSGMPMTEAIALVAADNTLADRPFVRLARSLESGMIPADAIKQAGFLKSIRQTLLRSLAGDQFSELFAIQSELANRRNRILLELGASLAYPICLCFLMYIMIVLAELLLYPVLCQIASDFDITMSSGWLLIINSSHVCTNGSLFLCLFVFFLFACIVNKTCAPRFVYRLPLIGSFRLLLYQNAFLRTMAILLRRGVPLAEALLACKTCGDNKAFQNDLQNAANDANRGMSPVDLTLRYHWLFPIWLAPLLLSCQSGEKQADVLEHEADWLDLQIRRSIIFLQSFVTAFVYLLCAVLAVSFFGVVMTPFFKLIAALSK